MQSKQLLWTLTANFRDDLFVRVGPWVNNGLLINAITKIPRWQRKAFLTLLKEKVTPEIVFFLSSPIKILHRVTLTTEVSAFKVHPEKLVSKEVTKNWRLCDEAHKVQLTFMLRPLTVFSEEVVGKFSGC